MKLAGGTRPCSGWRQRAKGLEAEDLAIDDRLRLVMDADLSRSKPGASRSTGPGVAAVPCPCCARRNGGATTSALPGRARIGMPTRAVASVRRWGRPRWPMLRPIRSRCSPISNASATCARRRSASAAAVAGCGPVRHDQCDSSPPRRAGTRLPPPLAAAWRVHTRAHRNGMAANIVDLLEMIEIDADDRKGLTGIRRKLQRCARCSAKAARLCRSVNAS